MGGDVILPSYVTIIVIHYKDPYKAASVINGKYIVKRVFFLARDEGCRIFLSEFG